MPTNLYGRGDNYHPEYSHVVAALIRRFHEAKVSDAPNVVVWGTGTPRREFLYVDDLADACVHLLKHYDDALFLNVGSGTDLSIAELATVISGIVGFDGRFVYDSTRPDGTPRKLLNSARLFALGWRPGIPLDDGIRSTYEWYLRNVAERSQN
jgi:GDP-L-fucose synthase